MIVSSEPALGATGVEVVAPAVRNTRASCGLKLPPRYVSTVVVDPAEDGRARRRTDSPVSCHALAVWMSA